MTNLMKKQVEEALVNMVTDPEGIPEYRIKAAETLGLFLATLNEIKISRDQNARENVAFALENSEEDEDEDPDMRVWWTKPENTSDQGSSEE